MIVSVQNDCDVNIVLEAPFIPAYDGCPDAARALPDDSSDGIKFTEKEVGLILGGNAAKLLNL